MNHTASTTTDHAIEAPGAGRTATPFLRALQWSVRLELWQHRWIVIGPLVAASILVATSVLEAIGAPGNIAALLARAPDARRVAIAHPYGLSAGMIAMAAFFMGIFYCIEALQSERSDRSILFWKSLPVSDATIVLSKAWIPLVVLPLIVYAVTLVAQTIMAVTSTFALIATGGDPAALWRELSLERPIVHLYGIAVMAILHSPLYAWILMVSAWARRRALVWVFLPPYLIGAAEQLAFGHSNVKKLVGHLIMEPFARGFALDPYAHAKMPAFDRVAQIDPASVFGRPGTWIGLAATTLFLLIAIQFRRDRELT